MGNINNFNINKIDLKLSNSDYWDFYLANGSINSNSQLITSGDCFVVWYDFNNSNIFISGNTNEIYSLVSWDKSVNSGYTLNTIGLTGIDNGFIPYVKDNGDQANENLVSLLTGSTLNILSGDSRLILTAVSGSTGDFSYGSSILSGATIGRYLQLNGGFYQGFYKLDGYSYQVLPTRVNQSWSSEFWLKPENTISSGNTLNDLYPENKGFFFYMGTRAENKFWNEWLGADTGCTSGCTSDSGCTDTVSEWCTIPKEDEIVLIGDYGVGVSLNPPRVDVDLITNNFLIYGRGAGRTSERYSGITGSMFVEHASSGSCYCNSCMGPLDGLGSETVCSYDGNGIIVSKTRKIVQNETNPFLIYGRAYKHSAYTECYVCDGPNDGFGNETVCSFSGFTSDEKNINYNLDIIDNALGFRVKDDGSIGYRLLTVTGTCSGNTYVSGVSITEEYSLSGLVSTNEWSYIVIKFVTDYKDDCELKYARPRKGRLLFYINGFLKFIINDFDELIAKRLDEYKDKQIGVPFNISIGGGSQGLLESQTFGGLDFNDRNLPIEKYFGGTFIGGISQFKFNICDLSLYNIRENYKNDLLRYI